MRHLLLAVAILLAGCSEPTFSDRFADIESGMSYAEVTSILGEGSEMPNISGDNRRLLIYENEGRSYAVAFRDNVCVGARVMP